MQRVFEGSPFTLERISAVSGKLLQLPMPEFDQEKFSRAHGRGVNVYEIACHLSHLKALQAFLDTSESHAMICEDDLHPTPELARVLEQLMKTSQHWNIARLAGLKFGCFSSITPLCGGYSLVVPLQRLKGTGAYLIDRKGAAAFMKGMLPIFLPFDHAIDREWCHGIQMVAVAPFPISQTEEEFSSAIQGNSQPRLSASLRRRYTYPYQIKNEICRYLFRGMQVLRLKFGLRNFHHAG